MGVQMRPLAARIGVDPYGDGSTTQVYLIMLWSIHRSDIDIHQMSSPVRQRVAEAFGAVTPSNWFLLKDIVQDWTED